MPRRRKVELYEEIRREYEHGVGTIKGVARKLGVHRRMVREAIANAVPPVKKTPVCERPKLGPAREFILLYSTIIAYSSIPRLPQCENCSCS